MLPATDGGTPSLPFLYNNRPYNYENINILIYRSLCPCAKYPFVLVRFPFVTLFLVAHICITNERSFASAS
jgi:hypothetical protein